MKYSDLQKAVIDVLRGKTTVDEGKIKHPNQQKLDVHEPEKDELTAKDFEMLRKGKKAEVKEAVSPHNDLAGPKDKLPEDVELDEATQQASTTMKHIKNPTAGEKQAAKDIKPGIAGYRDRIAMLKSAQARGGLKKEEFEMVEGKVKQMASDTEEMDDDEFKKSYGFNKPGTSTKPVNPDWRATHSKIKERLAASAAKRQKMAEESEVDEQPVKETIIYHDNFEIEIAESHTFGDYLAAAKKLVGEEDAVELANVAFNTKDVSIFAEGFSHAAIEDKIKAHSAAGHKVSMPKYSTRDGKPRAEYVVTDKETGVRRKYIHQGNVTKMENMGAKGKKDE